MTLRYDETALEVRAKPQANIHRIYDLLWISGGWWDGQNIGDRLNLPKATVSSLCTRHPDLIEKRTVKRNRGFDVTEYRARRRTDDN